MFNYNYNYNKCYNTSVSLLKVNQISCLPVVTGKKRWKFCCGACRHTTRSRLRVTCTCALSLIYAQSTASQRVRVAATIQILFGKNCRIYEIWGLKIASEAISKSLKLTKFSWGRIPPDPPRYYMAMRMYTWVTQSWNSSLWPCLSILQIHSDTFVTWAREVCCAQFCPRRLFFFSIKRYAKGKGCTK